MLSKEGVWITALGGLALHVCTSFIINRQYVTNTDISLHGTTSCIFMLFRQNAAMSLVSSSSFPGPVSHLVFRIGCANEKQAGSIRWQPYLTFIEVHQYVTCSFCEEGYERLSLRFIAKCHNLVDPKILRV